MVSPYISAIVVLSTGNHYLQCFSIYTSSTSISVVVYRQLAAKWRVLCSSIQEKWIVWHFHPLSFNNGSLLHTDSQFPAFPLEGLLLCGQATIAKNREHLIIITVSSSSWSWSCFRYTRIYHVLFLGTFSGNSSYTTVVLSSTTTTLPYQAVAPVYIQSPSSKTRVRRQTYHHRSFGLIWGLLVILRNQRLHTNERMLCRPNQADKRNPRWFQETPRSLCIATVSPRPPTPPAHFIIP